MEANQSQANLGLTGGHIFATNKGYIGLKSSGFEGSRADLEVSYFKVTKEEVMAKVFGGLFLENLVSEDRFFGLQMLLFRGGLIQGIQPRVAHPCYTPGLFPASLGQVLAKLPEGLEVFIHFGSENRGVDFGRKLDETGAYQTRGRKCGISWPQWNGETMRWGKAAGDFVTLPSGCPLGVVHPGYGLHEGDWDSRTRLFGF